MRFFIVAFAVSESISFAVARILSPSVSPTASDSGVLRKAVSPFEVSTQSS